MTMDIGHMDALLALLLCSSSTPFILAKAVADVAKEINDPESMWPHSPKSTAARNGLAKF